MQAVRLREKKSLKESKTKTVETWCQNFPCVQPGWSNETLKAKKVTERNFKAIHPSDLAGELLWNYGEQQLLKFTTSLIRKRPDTLETLHYVWNREARWQILKGSHKYLYVCLNAKYPARAGLSSVAELPAPSCRAPRASRSSFCKRLSQVAAHTFTRLTPSSCELLLELGSTFWIRREKAPGFSVGNSEQNKPSWFISKLHFSVYYGFAAKNTELIKRFRPIYTF